MSITTQFITYLPSALTVRAIGASNVHSITFDSVETAELEMKRAGYRFLYAIDGGEIWARMA